MDAGWLGMQRLTHEGAPFAHLPSLSSPGHAEPQPVTTVRRIIPTPSWSRPQHLLCPRPPQVLHKGDTLLFTATTKHAATPNPSYETRCLLYTCVLHHSLRRTSPNPNPAPRTYSRSST